MTKDNAIWIFGLIAAGLAGGLVGNHHGYDGAIWGTLWGAFAFWCVRVWIGIEQSRAVRINDPSKEIR
jgi:hypothetical protein